MQGQKPIVVGTAGHIDHGKTTLVRALTGVDTDRLEEEKRRGITIVLGFAPLTLPGGRPAAVIDVPGHERFVRTMVAGAVGIDIALLVVSAEEGVMPQTREHLAILGLLGVPVLVVAVTRMDAVEPDLLELAALDVRDLLATSPWPDAPVLPVSGKTMEGVSVLLLALKDAADSLPPRPQSPRFRMPVDRSFVLRGFGVVVTGTAWSGTLAAGGPVEVMPGRRPAKIRTVQVHGQDRVHAEAGERIALSVQGVELSELRPGDWISTPGALAESSCWDVRVQLLPGAPFVLKDGGHVRVHHGTAESLCTLRIWDADGAPADELLPGEAGLARFSFPAPLAAAAGDRFVLRAESPLLTLGGGVVLDPVAPVTRRIRRAALGVELVALRDTLGTEEGLRQIVARSGPGALGRDDARRRLPWNSGEVSDEGAALVRAGLLLRVGADPPSWIDAALADEHGLALLSGVAAWHLAHPLLPGPSGPELKGALVRPLQEPVLITVVDALVARGTLERRGTRFCLPGRSDEPDPAARAAMDQVVQRLQAGDFHPPPVEQATAGIDLPPDALAWLAERGEIIRIAEDFLIARDPYRELVRRVVAHLEAKDGMSPAEFKDISGLSRRHAIPFLEHLDRQRITSRGGEGRTLREKPAWC